MSVGNLAKDAVQFGSSRWMVKEP